MSFCSMKETNPNKKHSKAKRQSLRQASPSSCWTISFLCFKIKFLNLLSICILSSFIEIQLSYTNLQMLKIFHWFILMYILCEVITTVKVVNYTSLPSFLISLRCQHLCHFLSLSQVIIFINFLCIFLDFLYANKSKSEYMFLYFSFFIINTIS